ncbi:MAG TPA: YncE family protein [Pyrinomonadaceae bacterium]|jgi:YVTN family beta-propeller protein|nr:YncE family protein [Pyrinomonadaceae bacterium]
MRRQRNLSRTVSLLFLSALTLSSLMSASIVRAQNDTATGVERVRVAGTTPTARTKAPDFVTQRFEKDGIVIDFSVKALPSEKGASVGLVAGANAIATFRLTDARTGQPITGLHPAAWISSRKSEPAPNEAACRDKVRLFTGGLMSVRADIDLNTYLLLTLNHDNTITFTNPQVAFSVTKLESIIALPGPGADWALSQNKEFLYVTLPEQAAIGVVNTVTRKLVATIPTDEKSAPMRIALQPDGRFVWVGLDGSAKVAVLDTSNNKLAATVKAGAGLHNIAFTADSRTAYVTNSAADTVSVIDTKMLAHITDIKVGKTPVPVAYSGASKQIYVATLNGATIEVIDPVKQRVVKSIPVRRGTVALRFEPKGRFAFAVNQVESKVFVLDSATDELVAEAEVVKEPDQVIFTSRYAYVRGTQSEKISLIELGQVGGRKISPVDVTAGRQAPSSAPQEIGVADMIAPTPEGNAVMVANSPDQMLYYYVEGMMAPMGTFTNYKRRPRALLVLNRSLSETDPGVYSTPVKLTAPGRYDVPVLVDQPRLVNCFQLEVAPSPEGEETRAGRSITVEHLFKDKRFKPQEVSSLRLRIIDPATKQPVGGLTDVQVLVFEPPGIWQQRQWAREVEKGVYEVMQTFPREGQYKVMVRVSSRGTSYADLPFVTLTVTGDK